MKRNRQSCCFALNKQTGLTCNAVKGSRMKSHFLIQEFTISLLFYIGYYVCMYLNDHLFIWLWTLWTPSFQPCKVPGILPSSLQNNNSCHAMLLGVIQSLHNLCDSMDNFSYIGGNSYNWCMKVHLSPAVESFSFDW